MKDTNGKKKKLATKKVLNIKITVFVRTKKCGTRERVGEKCKGRATEPYGSNT